MRHIRLDLVKDALRLIKTVGKASPTHADQDIHIALALTKSIQDIFLLGCKATRIYIPARKHLYHMPAARTNGGGFPAIGIQDHMTVGLAAFPRSDLAYIEGIKIMRGAMIGDNGLERGRLERALS